MTKCEKNTILKGLGYTSIAIIIIGILSIMILGFGYNLKICKEPTNNTKCITNDDKDFIRTSMIITGSVLLSFLIIVIVIIAVYSHYSKNNIDGDSSDDQLLIDGRPYCNNFY